MNRIKHRKKRMIKNPSVYKGNRWMRNCNFNRMLKFHGMTREGFPGNIASKSYLGMLKRIV